MLTAFARDLKIGVRQVRQGPGFSAVAVLSLALGIGLNTTLFSVVNAVLFRGGHLAHPESLVEIYTSASKEFPPLTTSYPDFLDIGQRAGALEGLAAHAFVRGIISSGDRPALVTGETVTANYFDLLGIRLLRGRGFSAEEAAAEGSTPLVVLSHALWQQRFGGGSLVGGQIVLSNRSYTVIGIAPAGFAGTVPGIVTDFWVPVTMVDSLVFAGVQWSSDDAGLGTRIQRRGLRWLFVKGRLRPGHTVEEARAQVETIVARLAREYPASNTDVVASVIPASSIRFHPMLDGYIRAASAGLLAAVGLVLLIACANVANLLMARGAARRRELAIRTAVGASPAALVRLLLADGLVLASLGGGLGLLLSWWAGWMLTDIGTDVFPIPVRFEFAIDGAVLAFAAGVSLATVLVFALLPALSSSRPDLVSALKDVAEEVQRARFGPRSALVIGQLALSLVLLASGALLLRGLLTARHADLGFEPEHVASLTFDLQMNGYDEARARALRDRALDALGALPGVTAVSYASRLPLAPDIMVTGVTLPGRQVRPQDQVLVDVVNVGPGYFDAVGVPIVRGRAFVLADIEQRRQVLVVNETMARTLWPGGDALGRRVQLEGHGSEPWEVIGVARNHKVRSVGEPPRPYMHLPEGQSRAIGLVVRTAGPADRLLPALRKSVLALEPNIVFTEDAAASAIAETTLAPTRIGALVIGAFGVLALVLASVGLYGVIAYAVSRRTREIGVRLALGATRGDVLRLILSQGLRLAIAGVVLGGAGAVAAGKLLASLLYGVRAWDPIALGFAATLLLVIAVAANLAPACAAARTDPLRALRTE